MIPSLAKQTIDNYVQRCVPPGGFITSFLANDLMGAIGKADLENGRHLRDIGEYIFNNIPSKCHGSYEAVTNHLKGKQ